MAKSWSRWSWELGITSSLAISGAITYSGNCAFAQLNIIPDDTFGTIEKSKVTPDLLDPLVDRVEGGAIRGANLFHSFSEFNVRQGRAVDFANPAGVENILSRITGNDPSDILGRLGVSGNANLFLITPFPLQDYISQVECGEYHYRHHDAQQNSAVPGTTARLGTVEKTLLPTPAGVHP